MIRSMMKLIDVNWENSAVIFEICRVRCIFYVSSLNKTTKLQHNVCLHRIERSYNAVTAKESLTLTLSELHVLKFKVSFSRHYNMRKVWVCWMKHTLTWSVLFGRITLIYYVTLKDKKNLRRGLSKILSKKSRKNTIK